MSKYYVSQNIKRCIGCRACEVHCKDKNSVTQNAFYCKMMEVGPRPMSDIPATDYVYMACFHCEKPGCVSACPTGAMQRRKKDGIVFVDPGLCVGCKSCMSACAWGVPQWNPETGKVGKCDLCKDRIDQGLKPACVTKCTTGCLSFDTPDNASADKRQSYAENLLKA